MKNMKRISSFLLALAMILSLSVSAFAADSSITFNGKEAGFGLQPGTEYTDSDLFDNFKNVMPGDSLTETITFTNKASDCDYVKLYMRAVAHDEVKNPLTYDEEFENEDGKDQADVTGKRDETVATMSEFLAQLSMKVYNGDKLIYEASPDKLGGLAENVLLGEFRSGETATLKVQLDVPITLGNEFAYRVGEVDWVFTVEGFNDPVELTVKKIWAGDKVNIDKRPTSVSVTLYNGQTPVETVKLGQWNNWSYTWDNLDSEGDWSVREVNIPKGYSPSYKTRGNTVTITNTAALIQTGQLNWPILVLGGLGVLMLAAGIILMTRKRKNEHA